MEFSLGLVEVSALGNAIAMLDEMLKAADVEFVAVERRLGGRLVTIVVRGTVSSVTASVEAGKSFAQGIGCLKAAEVIARPHSEILKFLHLDEKEKEPEKEASPAIQEKPAADDKKKSKAPAASDIKKTPKKRSTKKVK